MNPTFVRTGLALTLGAAILGACTDAGESPVASGAVTTLAAAPDEQEGLSRLTRLTAVALQDQGLRQRILNDLRSSRHTTEHKVAFTEYLNGSSGGILLAKMAKESGMSREDVLALVSAVRPLEFYMPVEAHRSAWRGGDDLIVAGLLDNENEAPIGWTVGGTPVVLSAEDAPATPVLSLVPVETHFDRPLGADFVNVGDNGGQSIGTLMPRVQASGGPSQLMEQPCEYAYNVSGTGTGPSLTCDGGGGGSTGGTGGTTTTKPGGLYMTYSSISDDGEAWAKGNPEIEVHIHGPNGGDKTYGADLACAGEKQTDIYRKFNQDSRTWSGEVLLFNKSQITNYNTAYGTQGFNVMLWEDDDTACTIKTDKDIRQTLQAVGALVGATATLITMPDSAGVGQWLKTAGAFIGALYASASWLLSNDDFLGTAPQVGTGVTRSTIYKSSSSTNGYIDTVLKYM